MSKNNETRIKPKNKRRSGNMSLRTRIFKIWGFLLFLAVIIVGAFTMKKMVIPLASMYVDAAKLVRESDAGTFKTEQTTIIYDTDGQEMKKMKGDKDVYYLPYKDIPDSAKLAIIAVEDQKFTSHRGVDLIGITRAMLSLILNRGEITMGGSTITQQLAKVVFLNYERTYSRKLKEIFIAMQLEQKYSKEEILEFYLNNVYFANSFYGIEAAAEGYFNKEAKDLTISEIAFLCAIPNSPSRYDPYSDLNATLQRRDHILRNMHKEDYISDAQYNKSVAEEITVQRKNDSTSNDYAQTYIIRCATEALMRAEGFEFRTVFGSDDEKELYDQEYSELYDTCRQSLNTAGYRIYTSIDSRQQELLQDSVSSQLSMFTEKSDDGVFKVQGAAVCIDNDSGMVTAIVGGREEDQEGYGLNRAYQSYRQPGSVIKPILVYTPALENGYTPDSTLDDNRMTGTDSVSNAGYVYLGHISLRKAVEVSSNVATYRLYQELGSAKCMKYLEALKFKGLDPKDYRYDTTCLGGFTTGVTGVEMAASYATLANDGIYRSPDCIEKITDAQGNELVSYEPGDTQIYKANAARQMTDVLETCVTSGSATAHVCQLDVDMPAACKTGTTSDYVDGWLCGYTPYYTTAVWVGKDIYQPVDNLKGNTYPADIWKNYMDKIHQGLARKEFNDAVDQ